MASAAVNDYITKRYDRWLDYSLYHCGHVGIKDEAIDVLNEVLCSLLQKNDRLLNRLLETKKNGYTELDFFILKMIKLNITSPTSPYQNKYKHIPADDNVDYTRLELEDIQEDQTDRSEIVLEKMHQIRDIFESLDLSEQARSIFEYRFFQDGNFSEWEGEKSQKDLYDTYNGVISIIKRKLSGELIF